MKQEIGHLSDAQIEESASKSPGEISPSVEAHLSECELCLDRLLTSQRTQFSFLESHGMRTEAYTDCPQPEVLQEIAAESRAPESADPVLKHAAQCDYCGPLFNRYLQEFSDDYSPELKTMLQSFPSTQERQQKDLARKLAAYARGGSKTPQPPPIPTWQFWKKAVAWATPLAAVMLVAVGFGPTLRNQYELYSAKTQVKQAYRQQRTTAMQLAGMPHSQYVKPNRVLGPHDTDNDAPALLTAKGALNEHVKSGKPLDSDWLQVQGRIYLLQGSPDKAEKVLKNALTTATNSAPIMIDLAAAYYERGDYAKAIDTLVAVSEDAKAADSDKATVLFNLAVVYQTTEMWDMAADTWKKFLAKQSSGPWAEEARDRLAAAEKKLQWHKQQGQIILSDPAKFIAGLGSPAVQQNAEEYINTALISWIPHSTQSPQNDFFLADQKLADLLIEKPHSDPWFHDFLNALKPGDTAGLVALQQAIYANQQQHADDAKKSSETAALAFRTSHNPAGEMRAIYERVYAYQRSLDGQGCLNQIGNVESRLRSSSYHGLLSQLLVEKAICEKQAGRPGKIDDSLNEAQQLAENFHFNVFSLRVMGIGESLKKEAGLCPAAWTKASRGLEAYWQGRFPLERLYQLYQPLSECAEKQELWHTADTFREHAVAIRTAIDTRNGKDSIMLGSAYLDWASILVALKKDTEAKAAIKKAGAIFEADGHTPTNQKYKDGLTIRLAELQLNTGEAATALKTLEPLLNLPSGDAVIMMWANRVLGDIYRANRKLDQAAAIYEAGLILSERSLATVSASQERLEWIAAADKIYRGLTEIWLQQNRPDDAWKLWEWYKGRSIQVSGNQEIRIETKLSWAELEKKILQPLAENSSTPRIVYAVFDDTLQTWIVHGGRVTSHTAPVSRAEIERRTNLLFERASNPSSDLKDVWKAGEDLYPRFWSNIESDLPKSGIVVVELDAPLQHLLLEALRSDNHYLTERFQFIYSPGVYMDTRLRATRVLDSNSLTFLLDASTSSGESPIPSQLQEVRSVNKGMLRTSVREGATVTLPEIRSDLQHNEIFFFAGHGLRDGKDLSLIVNPNLFVRSADLLPANLSRLQLAILAACSTGTSDENGLMDTRSLDNSFLAAGVPRVISSRWDVDSDSTADLMEGMVAKLGKKIPVAAAMYAVQLDLMKREQHPYYWASFYLAGKAN